MARSAGVVASSEDGGAYTAQRCYRHLHPVRRREQQMATVRRNSALPRVDCRN